MQRLIYRVTAHQRRAFSLKTPKFEQRVRSASKLDSEKNKNNYKHTILYPTTKFPRMIPKEEHHDYYKQLLYESCVQGIYYWQSTNLSEPKFILHDGPPYANGPPHIGHAINKILKDIVNRSHLIRGRKVEYRPGFDCHGLPIELEVLKQNQHTDPNTIRNAACKLAEDTAYAHTGEYKDWWILADFNLLGCYYTHKPAYLQKELYCFLEMYEKGLIYRDFKPVHWSPSSRTALAESELVYNSNHKSTAAYVRFEISNLPKKLESFQGKRVYAIIWTTTPWTLVANQAVAFSENITYCLAKDASDNYYIIALDLFDSVTACIGSLEIQEKFSGKELANTKYYHPINGETLPFLAGSHVTATEGTGLVHTAPGHGREDFLLAREHNLSVLSVVNENGCYTSEAGARFSGLEVMGKGTKEVLKCIEHNVLNVQPFTHRYAYDWRTNQPIIMRASSQWFIDLEPIKDKAIDALKDVAIYPTCNRSSLLNGLEAQIKQRPYWCISRQRTWGAYIPALYHKETGDVIVNRILVEALCEQIDCRGIDAWYTYPLEELFEPIVFKRLGIDPADYTKGKDILDVWFDSGVSWSAVLNEEVADLYLEGTDQFTGWFQSSLLTSIALRGRPPYKAIFAHGFAVDKNGKKMSKSLGNGVSPDVIIHGGTWEGQCPGYGLDALRWWVASHACQHSMIPVKKELFADSERCVNSLRSTFHYLLGVLAPKTYTPKAEEPEYRAIDKFMLHNLYEYNKKIQENYDDYAFHHVCKAVLHFMPNMVNFYINLTKSRLLFDGVDSDSRRAAVNVMRRTLSIIIKSIAPILPRLADEVWYNHPESMEFQSIFYGHTDFPESWRNDEIKSQVDYVLNVKELVPKQCRGDLWKRRVTIQANEESLRILRQFQTDETSSTSDLCELFGCISVTLKENEAGAKTDLFTEEVSELLCVRCRKRIPTEYALCNRCVVVLAELNRPRDL